AFDTTSPLSFADLRAARGRISDADAYTRTRAQTSFEDTKVFAAFDAIGYVPHTDPTDAALT
ncbi:MAG: hypothetical protein ACRD0P_39865, partial [Stackebrandtia sp.]